MMAAPSLALLQIMAGMPDRKWSLLQLQEASGMTAAELAPVLAWLRQQRLIRGHAGLHFVTLMGLSIAAEPPPVPPQPEITAMGTLVWRALRMQRKASAAELLDVIGNAATKSALRWVRDYLNALVPAGVVEVSRFKGAKGERLYLLNRDLGPLAPARCRNTGCMIDTNSGQPLMEAAHAG